MNILINPLEMYLILEVSYYCLKDILIIQFFNNTIDNK